MLKNNMANSKSINRENSIRFIGCCGAYCKTCKASIEEFCKGCKLGYGKGERDINKAKCDMKVCCFKEKELETCADRPDYPQCKTIHNFYNKNGYKYKKYKQAIELIREHGYSKFIKSANKWKGAYGPLD